MSAPGQLVEYLQARRLILGFCLRKDRAGSLLVRNEDNREEKVPLSKILLTCDSGLPPEASADAVVGRLREAVRQRESIAASIPLGELWELLKDEEAPGGYSLTDLARIYFGDGPAPEEISGLFRALEADRVYFQRKGDRYLPRPAHQVEESLTRMRVEAEREEERRGVADWLARLWQHSGPGPAPPPPAGLEDAARRYLTWLRETALFGAEARRFQEVSALLRSAGISRKDAAFRLLVKAGVWSEHENLALHRNRVSVPFAPDLVEEARRLAADPSPLEDPTRLDLRHLFCFSVDDPTTTEIDDALSFERTETGWRVGVHIADASAYVPPESPIDREARQRATAIYLPDLKVLMLPPPLSEGACSLTAGSDRPAFSFLVDFDRDFRLQGWLATPSLIRVGQRHSYDSADEWLAQDEEAAEFLALARALRSQRRQAGAVTIPLPRVQVRLDASGHPLVEKEATSAPSQVLVSEMMIMANGLAGQLLAARGAPAIYRSQPAPDPNSLLTHMEEDEEIDPVLAYASRRFMRRGEMGLTPARHHGLGLDAYVQVTSPIRRYTDLAMQRQLKGVLAGQPLYSQEEVQAILDSTRQAVEQAEQMERERKAYWVLRWLEERCFQEMDAVVLQNLPDRHLVQLTDVLWETECPHLPGHPLPPGSRLRVRIELVWPRDGIVRITPVGPREED